MRKKIFFSFCDGFDFFFEIFWYWFFFDDFNFFCNFLGLFVAKVFNLVELDSFVFRGGDFSAQLVFS